MRPEAIVDFVEALARITASGGGPEALAAHLEHTAGGAVLLEEVDLLLRMTAAAGGVELGRDSSSSRGAQANFWDMLAARGFRDAASARDEAVTHGIALAPQYLVVVLAAEASDETPQADGAAELRALAADAFRSGDADLGFAERDGSLLVFVPAARSVDASNAKTAAGLLPRNAARRKSHLRVSGGVGIAQTLPGVRAGVATAHAAHAIGRRLFGSGRVVAYDELGAYPLLYEGADVPRLRAFAAEMLAPLRAYDETHQTELERTLKLYFSRGQNIKTAAAELNVHRHTIFYRLRQIGEITSRSLENAHDQLTLRLAIAIHELHE